jgi:hypothetical protein
MATHYEVLPIPAFLEYTRMFEAGAVTIGIEYRLLNEEIIESEYGEDSRAKFGGVLPPNLPAVIDEDGVSIHVFGTQDGAEYLRFDCFGDYPHYHYIDPKAERQTVMEFEPDEHGPMFDWVLDCLSERLVAMLETAGAEALAARVDPAVVAGQLAAVRAEILAAARRGAPAKA